MVAILSEEKTSSWLETFRKLRKINPFAFILLFVGMNIFNYLVRLDLPLEDKLLPLIMSSALFLLCVFFESWRIEKESELREEAFRKGILGE
jgi:hypothetical protein